MILIRLPYDKSGEYTAMPATAARMNARGYHVVVQDVRGKFRSEGETVMFVHEAADGSDTIDWVIARPWSNGHLLRLTIASSDALEFVVAPGTGEHRWLATDRVRNEQRITVGGSSPAVLTVHVLPGTS